MRTSVVEKAVLVSVVVVVVVERAPALLVVLVVPEVLVVTVQCMWELCVSDYVKERSESYLRRVVIPWVPVVLSDTVICTAYGRRPGRKRVV